ncbi:putative nuclease domain protein [Trichophyton verrucosum HKI 0517]|uniref:Probable endonuclease LCL3 n=1 Tax=Trichophyton verrucosum (strain HKI 0517) TaxID=663202 RepID=D4D8S7_TRIVH|nr:putative nuclease domain protein [Trichophyton verrucosum HKI 0517]EFE41686.1 putative nuclease domain protein [Trichophyton verrucosum HKI 0517]
MRWLFWTSDNDKDECNCNSKPSSNSNEKPSTLSRATKDWNALSNATNWSHFIEPSNLIPTILLTSGILFAVRIHRRYLRRIPEAPNISPSYLRQRSILGKVTSVGDGDNFRIYHTPGGMLAGWGWLRKVPTSKKDLKNNTVRNLSINIVISLVEISNLLTDSHPPDQYSRVVATVYAYRFLFFPQDIGLQMLREGLATVYEAKSGAEFGGPEQEKKYRNAEALAKKKGKGLWKTKGSNNWESPRDFKSRMNTMDQEKGSSA